MITADQLLAHALGDYLLQSDWMAQNKTQAWLPAATHAMVYSLPFLFVFAPSRAAFLVIVLTHYLIDRYRLARYVVYVKNFLGPVSISKFFSGGDFTVNPCWGDCSATGYPADRPAWLAVWLLIIADNVCHVAINGAALKWL